MLDSMKVQLEEAGLWGQPVVLDEANLPFWEVPSEDFTSFLTSNVNKFLFAFEYGRSLAQGSEFGYERPKVLSMLLETLQHSYDATSLRRVRGLSRDRHQESATDLVVHGMGMTSMIA